MSIPKSFKKLKYPNNDPIFHDDSTRVDDAVITLLGNSDEKETLEFLKQVKSPEQIILAGSLSYFALPDQILSLQALTYKNSNKKIINENDQEIIMEIVSMLGNSNFERTKDYLLNQESKETLIWNQPLLEEVRKKAEREAVILRNKESGVKGLGRCGKCGGEYLTQMSLQTSSGDEQTTVFVRCVGCNFKWRQG